jgi:MFS family permease
MANSAFFLRFGKSLTRFWQRFDIRVWVIFFSQIVTSMGFALAMPFISIYFHSVLGVAMSIVGTIFLIRAAVAAAAQVVGGELSDRFGRKRVMVSSLVFRIFLFLLLAAAVALHTHYLVVALVMIVGQGVGSLFMPASQAVVADVIEPRKRVEAYGLLRVGGNLGWAIGPIIGGFLARGSYAWLFVATAFASLITTVLIAVFIREPAHARSPKEFKVRDLLHLGANRPLLIFCGLSLLIFIVAGQLIAPLSVFAVERVGISTVQLGYLFTINGLLVVVFQFPIATLIGRIQLTSALALGSFLYALGYFSVGIAPSFLFLALSMVVITAGEVMVKPAGMSLAANMAPPDQKGRYIGIYGLTESLGWSLGPFMGGILLDVFAKKAMQPWVIIAVLGIAAMIGFRWFRSKIPIALDRSLEPQDAETKI